MEHVDGVSMITRGWSRPSSVGHLLDHIPEQLIIAWNRLCDGQRLRDPGLVNQVAPGDVVVGAVATPAAAAEREGLAHAVPQIA